MGKDEKEKTAAQQPEEQEAPKAEEPQAEEPKPAAEEAGECEKKTTALEKALADEKEKLLRTAAEYANYRTRTEREKAGIYANAVSDTINELLPVADTLQRAIDASENAPEAYRKGLDMIAAQLAAAFEKLGITSFGEKGDAFDPEFHNAISSVDSDELESDTIACVFQKGYKLGDKIIRHAMVQTVN